MSAATVAIKSLVVAATILGVGWSIGRHADDARTADDSARATGFADAADQTTAQKEGYTTSAEWIAKKREREIARQKAAELSAELRRNPAERMTIASFNWSIGGFGNVGVVTATIENKNDFGVKDVQLACSFSGASGTNLSSPTHTVFDTIKANSRRTFKNMNVGFIHSQSAKGSCWVERAARI